MVSTLSIAAVTVGAAAAFGAMAQPSDDWDYAGDAARGLSMARVEYASGAGVFVQCQAGVLTVAIAETPLSAEAFASSMIERPGERPAEVSWISTADRRLATSSSRRVARLFYRGGAVRMRSIEGEGQPFRTEFDVPVQGRGLAQVLGDCGTPLTDDRDLLPSAEPLLTAIPAVSFPRRYSPRRGERQWVEISCIVRQARLSDCRSDLQIPANPEAGAAVAREAEGTPVRVSDVAAAEGGVIDIQVTGSR